MSKKPDIFGDTERCEYTGLTLAETWLLMGASWAVVGGLFWLVVWLIERN